MCVTKVPALMVALAAGYGVLVLSVKQQRPLDVLGRFIGGVILVVSFIGLLCAAYAGIMCHRGGSMCGGPGMMSKGCPYSAGAPADAPPAPAANPQ